MIKQIIFIVMEEESHILKQTSTKTYADKDKKQIELAVLAVNEWHQRKGSLLKDEEVIQNTLFLTDTGSIMTELLRQKCYVAALYHSGNSKEALSAAAYGIEDPWALDFTSYDQIYRRLAGIPWEILTTDRLRVRETTVEDVKQFYRIYQDPSITEYMETLYEDPEEEIAYTQAYIRQMYGFYGYGTWTVIANDTNRVIGRAGLSPREGYELPELGFVIEKAEQRKGYAYEVCSAILQYGKEELEFDRVQAFVKPDNQASVKLLQKLGFEEQEFVELEQKKYRRYEIKLESEN